MRPVARQLTKSAAQKRTFVAALGAATRATAAVARPALAGRIQQQTRGVKTIDFAGTKEDVYGEYNWEVESSLRVVWLGC